MLAAHGFRRHRRLEENSEEGRNEKRQADACDASGPPEHVEELAEKGRTHQPAEEVESEVEPARRTAVGGGGAEAASGGTGCSGAGCSGAGGGCVDSEGVGAGSAGGGSTDGATMTSGITVDAGSR